MTRMMEFNHQGTKTQRNIFKKFVFLGVVESYKFVSPEL